MDSSQNPHHSWRKLAPTRDTQTQNPTPPSSSSSAEDDDMFLVGFVIVNIVGLKHYSGTINGREMVGLVRDPLNPYDPNAIKVLNTRTHQVGYIERSSASVLSPLIDSSLVIVEGIVPKPPKNRNPYKLPCQIHIFSSHTSIPTVQSVISASELFLITDSDPTFGLSEAVIVKERNPKKGLRSIDEIFALVGPDGKGKGSARKVVVPPKDVITSELFLHQKEGLAWLADRENSCELPPFWEEKDGVYMNVLTNYQTHERPDPLRGGIFADDMGLGKTLTLLSLIAMNRPGNALPDSLDIDEYSNVQNVGNGKRSKNSKKVVGSRKKRKIDEGGGDSGTRTTLVVCPLTVFSTWITQLGEHTRPGSLKVYLYHGERTSDAKELRKFDIVLTTYSTLAAEENWDESPIKEIEWWRVILDEAHVIKNVAAKQSEAVIGLKAQRRWAVTGTPIQNGSLDLFSLMAFLRFQPFSIKSYWQSLVQRPLNQGSKSGLSRLQALMGTISLRRTKDSHSGNGSLVGLPPKTVETCFVELSPEEREQYDKMEFEAKQTVNEYIHAESVMRNYSTVLHIILRLRQICNDVALCPSDVRSLLPSSSIEDVSNNPDLLMKMVSMLQDGDDFDCPVCLCPPTKTIITCCAHIFCRPCILKTLQRLNPRCPICRHPLSESDLFSAPPQYCDDNDPLMSSGESSSSKVSMLLRLLVASRAENPSTKSVVFSQFRKMLILLEEPLKAAGFRILRLDGSLNAKRRAAAIKEFGERDQDAPTVLLASLKVAGTGINLTAASRVYLMEPWWNPAVEEQAMDRVHRIGQKDEVKVVRLIVRNSVEERILELQERKKNLAKGAFGKRGGKEQRQMHVEDLRTIMRL
ncbi:putative SWI/SNF-related matrix-associated actin-dependent regulator of chromatin subfamily A member 3-like 1 isoform X2 [Magnolia sinica]|nr:putative SWI/SNF-related matrix-associated actin-dependent regulator of chromatin subfamily A member 3-like 1 isoform X2 [Magnolia sinica]